MPTRPGDYGRSDSPSGNYGNLEFVIALPQEFIPAHCRNGFGGWCLVQVPHRVYPKSVIRHAGFVFDGENEAFGHLARFCPHPDSRYAST